jgi:GT2 family glycosyltransferase
MAALRCCLDALLRTTDRQDVEILVVDKGSRDGSEQLDSDYPGVTFLRLPRNFGYTKAVNIGTRTATGDYLFLLDPHTEVPAGAVAALTEKLESDADAIAVCPLLVDDDGAPLSRFRPVPEASGLMRAWKKGDTGGSLPADLTAEAIAVGWPPRVAVLVRRQFVKGMNYIDQRYGESGADAELFYQIWHANKKVLLLPEIKVLYRPETLELSADACAELSADEALAAALFASKHNGFFAGVGARLGAALHILIKLLTFQQPGYQMSRLMAVLGGQKIDGTQMSN